MPNVPDLYVNLFLPLVRWQLHSSGANLHNAVPQAPQESARSSPQPAVKPSSVGRSGSTSAIRSGRVWSDFAALHGRGFQPHFLASVALPAQQD